MSQTLVKYLNDQLLTEVESLLEFTLQSVAPEDERIQERLMDFARQELEHIRLLMRLLARAGGEVRLPAPRVSPSETLDEFFSRGQAREDDSIRRYEALIELLDSPGDKATLARAIAQEKAHRALLEEIRASSRNLRLE